MQYEYKTSGTCSRKITFTVEGGKVSGVNFEGGCHGNLQGIAALVEGMDAAEAIKRIKCGMKPTSCPDQLARALEQATA